MNGPAAVTTTVKKKKWKVVILLVGGIVLLCIAGFFIYVSIYYHADTTAWEALPSDNDVTVTEQDGALIFAPQEPRAGFIFYPGGKVEYQAYSPLLHTLAKEGFLCIAVKMPFNLAVFNPTAADGWQERYPAIQRWYIGGHSLGGSMAAVYASQHSQQLEGLILLAAYSAEDLSQSGLQVLSVYGSEDGVLNREKYQAHLSHLPADYQELVIQGGCHAWFGSYGRQEGDGEPTISPEEQRRQTVQFIRSAISEQTDTHV